MQSENLFSGGLNDTIAAVEGVISHRRVSISDSDGSLGSEMSADEVRKGHEAISKGGRGDVVVKVAPEGT